MLITAVAIGMLGGIPLPRGPVAATPERSGGVAMGGSWPGLPAEAKAADLDLVAASGAEYIRFTFNWANMEPNKGELRFGNLTQIADMAVARGVQVVAVIAFTPTWARADGCSTMFCAPGSVEEYARFAGDVARHFSGHGVHVYELWNEPNMMIFWQPQPNPEKYTQLLRAGYAAVHAADPAAVVLSAGLSPAPDADDGNRISPATFLDRMYAAGARGAFDHLAFHPYSYPVSPKEVTVWNAFSSVMPKLRRTMVERGDGSKLIWATEFGAPTAGKNGVDEQTQARIVVDAFDLQDQWSWLGPIIVYNARDLGTDPDDREDNFGMVRFDGTPKAAYRAFADALGGRRRPTPTSTTTAAAERPASTTTTARPAPPAVAAPPAAPGTGAARGPAHAGGSPSPIAPGPVGPREPEVPGVGSLADAVGAAEGGGTHLGGDATYCTRVFCVRITAG